jgi:hypothetical protein
MPVSERTLIDVGATTPSYSSLAASWLPFDQGARLRLLQFKHGEAAMRTSSRSLEKIDTAAWFNSVEPFGEEYFKLLLEQYKLYVDTTNKVSDRRGTAHTLLLTVNTSLVTVYGLVIGKDTTLAAAHGPWMWLVPLAGLLVAITWFMLIRAYRALNAGKFKVIHELELRLPGRLFDLEWEFLERGEGWKYTPLSHMEQYIPAAFGLFYLGLLGAAAGLF